MKKGTRLGQVAARINAAPFPNSLGIRVRVPRPGRAVATGPVRGSSRQVHGLAHGGWVATLADTCQTAAAFSAIEAGGEILTSDIHMRFLRGLKWGPARAEARVVKAGRRMVVVECNVFDARGEHIALGTYSNVIL
jgi:uncharacterized protein (TIGR00369 family)